MATRPAGVSRANTERRTEAGIELSVGRVGDSSNNALAEIVIGLFKIEVAHQRAPGHSLEALECATLAWPDWFNHRWLPEPIGNPMPGEAEERYFQPANGMPIAA